ncbi:o-succinylbenzoate synthase [Pseudonocardia sp. HH130630-07]|uniref:o-succinylbenzoate synthase n=1 Tax=Pseudonocardia sp. HH130630-07 TaxID=1690815 RepID=UPI000814B525|nr:o-succinylbenzoate synthase [Pseudonocardia sp. HH130630-07]ANY09450.1 o-succinylbenzoate synthase [Pseudonocardia sp. HH130630-07]
MKIVHARLHLVRLPLVHSFETSSHRKAHLDHILVELTDEDGHTGWGEIASPSDPYYTADTVESSWLVATRYLLPAVVGAEVESPGRLRETYARVRGNRFATAGIDAAGWALFSAARGTPLAAELGGTRDRVVAGVSLGIEPTVDELLAQVQRQVDAGYRRVKLKIAPGWDAEPVRAVRAAFGDLMLQVDANGAYRDEPAHHDTLRSLDGAGLLMIEQPFAPRDLLGSAALARRTATPICLDESIETVEDLRTADALGAGDIVNIKVSRMGGLTAAVRAHDVARELGWPAWCGGMHEFGVGRAANVALSSLPGFTLPSDVSASAKYYARDITEPITADGDGVVAVSGRAGLGVTVDAGFLATVRHRSHELGDRDAAPRTTTDHQEARR